MREEKYILRKPKTFNLENIFECGQCFRWNKETDNSYTGIWKENVVNVKKENDDYIFTGVSNSSNFEQEIVQYFDLNRDYETIKKELSKIDKYMEVSIKYGEGIRILNQDLWETIISFIISANNNIPRIKGIIERLSEKYGKQIEWQENKYYTFPSPEELKNVTVEEYRKLGLGFRDIRLYETTQKIINNEINLKELEKNSDTQEVRNKLLTLSGVGPKVADCILLFSTLKRFEVFPIDVWVRRVMNDLYIKEKDENKVNKKQIEKIANEKFGNLAGLAQQYLFYWRREA
ncbi:MAG: DNA-3-methyladenine glycosylase family protein [Clostridia bacterium]